MSSRLAVAFIVLCGLCSSTVETAAGEFAYSGSLQYATGRYTLDQPTTSLYWFNGLRWSESRLAAQLNIPLVLQSSSAAATMMGATVGVGDAFLRLEGELVRLRGRRPSLRLTVETKAPLSRMEPRFGTGEWDFGAGMSLTKRMGRHFIFADATYWKFGDPRGIDLRDAVAYGVSLGRPFGRLSFLASATGYSRLVSGIEPPLQAGLFILWWTNSRRSVSAGAVFGLTDAAPDIGLSLGWHIGF